MGDSELTYKTYIATATDPETDELMAVYGGQTSRDIEQRMVNHKIKAVCAAHGWRFSCVVVGIHPSRDAMTAAEDALIESLFETYSTRCLNEKRRSPIVQAANAGKAPRTEKASRRTVSGGAGEGTLPKGLAIHYPPQWKEEDRDGDGVLRPHAIVFLNGEVVGDIIELTFPDGASYWAPSDEPFRGEGYRSDVIFGSFAGALHRLLRNHAARAH